jgi:protein SCO1/2
VARAPRPRLNAKEKQVSHEFELQQRTSTAILTALILACLGISIACGPSQRPDAKQSDAKTIAEVQPTSLKRYNLTGRVISVDKPNQSINIDGDEIPGFMAAMKMPYPIKDTSILEKVSSGDQIKGEIVIGNEGAYLENVVVTTKAHSQIPTK